VTPDEENFGLQPHEKRKLEDFLGVSTEYVAFLRSANRRHIPTSGTLRASAKMGYHKLQDHDA
jgi:hypothetical protein